MIFIVMTDVKFICPVEIMIKCLLATASKKKKNLKLNSNADFLPMGLFILTI